MQSKQMNVSVQMYVSVQCCSTVYVIINVNQLIKNPCTLDIIKPEIKTMHALVMSQFIEAAASHMFNHTAT